MTLREHHALCLTTLASIYTKARNCDQETWLDAADLKLETEIMIEIQKSQTADTRTCDFANTNKETLLASSRQHIGDVVKALAFFSSKITEAAGEHDYDKLTTIDWFHADFVTGFKQTGWWDNHRKIHRHHLDKADGVPDDVNLLDIIEHISDCVMGWNGAKRERV